MTRKKSETFLNAFPTADCVGEYTVISGITIESDRQAIALVANMRPIEVIKYWHESLTKVVVIWKFATPPVTTEQP